MEGWDRLEKVRFGERRLGKVRVGYRESDLVEVGYGLVRVWLG